MKWRRSPKLPPDPPFPVDLYEVADAEPTADGAARRAFIDEFLERWDRYDAYERTDLVPALNRDVRRFNTDLVASLRFEPRWAVPRAVFYAAVQVAGFIPVTSPLGIALTEAVGDDAPPTRPMERGAPTYFAGELFFWWHERRDRFDSFPLLEDWMERPTTKLRALQLYTALRRTT